MRGTSGITFLFEGLPLFAQFYATALLIRLGAQLPHVSIEVKAHAVNCE